MKCHTNLSLAAAGTLHADSQKSLAALREMLDPWVVLFNLSGTNMKMSSGGEAKIKPIVTLVSCCIEVV
jgi:hypothetical protein